MRQYPHLSGSGIGEFCFPVLISCQRIDAGAEHQATVLIGGKRNHSMLHPAVFSAGIFYPQVVAEHIITIVLGGRVAGDVAKEGNLFCMVASDEERLTELVPHLISDFKLAIVDEELKQILLKLRQPDILSRKEEYMEIMKHYKEMKDIERTLARERGDRVIT